MPSILTGSCTSSVVDTGAPTSPGSPSGFRGGVRSALGGSSKSGLNHTSTYFYGEEPLKPMLCTTNQYNAVGSYSMFGSQVRVCWQPSRSLSPSRARAFARSLLSRCP